MDRFTVARPRRTRTGFPHRQCHRRYGPVERGVNQGTTGRSPRHWRKPATFGLSFGLTLATVAWVTSYLRISARTRAVLLGVFAADCVAEVAGITVQAWRHVPSHFNMETGLNTAVSMSLAVGGAILVAVLVTFAVFAFRGGPDVTPSISDATASMPDATASMPDVAPSMRLALRAGFATMLVALVSGAVMIARGVTLVRTGHQDLAYQLGGFLKPVHGVSLHGVLVLPVVAWLVGRLDWAESRRTLVVGLAAAGYAVAIAVALAWSLVGSLAP